MAANFDVLVIGEDAPSFCAAAAAAQAGARTALAAPPGRRAPASPSVCAIPDFVWRRLELQEFGLALEPVSARITLLAGGETTATYRCARQTAESLEQNMPDDAPLWLAITDEMRALGDSGARIEPGNVLAMVGGLRTLSVLGELAASSDDVVNDYLNGGPLSAHVVAHAMGPFGQSGIEAGSAAALPEFFSEDAWRARVKPGGRSILGALRKASEHHGVIPAPRGFRSAAADGARHDAVVFTDGERIRTRHIFMASPEAAAAAGYRGANNAAEPYNGARAVLRLKLQKDVNPPTGDKNALFQVLDSADDMKNARRDALDGRLAGDLPVTFEFTDKGDIIAQTAYIPKKLREENEWRDWTGQDRQQLTKIIIDRLASRIDGLRDNIQKTELSLAGVADDASDPFGNAQTVIVQPRRHDAVAAAVRLIDDVLRDG